MATIISLIQTNNVTKKDFKEVFSKIENADDKEVSKLCSKYSVSVLVEFNEKDGTKYSIAANENGIVLGCASHNGDKNAIENYQRNLKKLVRTLRKKDAQR